MKTLKTFAMLLALCCSKGLFSQCVDATLTYDPGACPSVEHFFFGMADVSCPDADHMSIQTQIDGSGASWETDNLNEGASFSVAPNPDGTGPAEVCVIFTAYDAGDNALGADTACLTNFWVVSPPMFVCFESFELGCGQNCIGLEICGGQWPYTFLWGNGIFTNNGFNCFTEPGAYFVEIMDANGCALYHTVIIPDVEDTQVNISCETATPLENMVMMTDSPCHVDPEADGCTNTGNNVVAWYTINSGDNTHMTVGSNAFTDFYHMAVYEAQGANCTNLTQVACEQNLYAGHCFDIEVTPNTDYYIQYIGDYASGEIDLIVNLGSEALENMCGCTSPNGCDYSPEALINEYDACGYGGCTDMAACNYIQWATCDNGSCFYGSNVNLQLYYDLNGDGIMQTGPFGDDPLGGTGYITIVETGTIVYADAEGQVALPGLPSGQYTITYTDENGIWALSPGQGTVVTLPSCNGLNVGLVPAGSDMMMQVSGSFWGNIHCVNGYNPGISILNTGSVPLNGTFTLSFDDVLVPIYYGGAMPYDSYANGVMVWNIVNQQPGTLVHYYCHIIGPGAVYVGDVFDFDMHLVLDDGEGGTFYENTWLVQPTVTCSYDPNDKSAEPVGYEQPHFILADDEIEYRIRFQNTGNAEAVDVVIMDTLDTAHLDLSTFYPVVASHSYSTIVDSEGHVQFVFDNINLPDSGSNEPASHGFVVYRIKPKSDVQGWDEIHNTAHIFFDDNDAIVTNTTTHTIYDCAWLEMPDQYHNVCEGESLSLEFVTLYVDTYEWTLNGELLAGNGQSIEIDFPGTGLHEIGVTRSNPLCSASAIIPVMVHETPEVILTYDVNTGIVSGPVGYFYEWYLYGDVLPQETDNTLDPWQYTVDGISVYAIVMDTWGCTATTNVIVDGAVHDAVVPTISVYPNPMSEQTTLLLTTGKWQVQMFDALGQLVQQWNNVSNSLVILNEGMASGTYNIRATDEAGNSASTLLMVR